MYEKKISLDVYKRQEETPERIRLTPEGLSYSDYIGQLFITPGIRQLMETYSY